MTKTPTVSLALRLLRQGITAETALKEDHGLEAVDSSVGSLLIGQGNANPPAWTGFVAHYNPDVRARLRTQSCSAVLFVEAAVDGNSRIFALCFGQGHHALDEDAIQRGFGLRVVLNSVSRNQLRTLDSASLDTTVMQRRVQASRDSDLSAFDLDANRNLLRLASGTPKMGDFANALTGKDVLHLRAAVAPDKLVEHCEKALRLFQATDYQSDFGFIDFVQPVSERMLCERLDAVAFSDLKSMVQGNSSDLHLAIPDILAPDDSLEIGYFGTGLPPGQKAPFGELAIEDYVAELKRGRFNQVADMSDLKGSHEIRVVKNGEGDKSHRRKIYSCFVHEVSLNNDLFILFDGQWFLISQDYHKEIEDAYQALLKPAFRTATTAKNEREFIAELEREHNLISMDQTKVSPKGASNANIEPCDFLSHSKQLIHLKDGHASAPLSHLWNQGLVSAEAFVSDEIFRKGFRRETKKRETKFGKRGFAMLIPDGRSKPVPGEYTVVFGVMRHRYAASGKLGLPFFSKVALRSAADRISRMGYSVELHLIDKQ